MAKFWRYVANRKGKEEFSSELIERYNYEVDKTREIFEEVQSKNKDRNRNE